MRFSAASLSRAASFAVMFCGVAVELTGEGSLHRSTMRLMAFRVTKSLFAMRNISRLPLRASVRSEDFFYLTAEEKLCGL
ncbi:hypothetical protein Q1M64_11995 (plasmid) [Sinorhizobium meliloti]|nr:hypothetical protein Q1M64_11995 [Sinorhizobium meliloti]